eukprot:3188685-Amphidinium_carterae.1
MIFQELSDDPLRYLLKNKDMHARVQHCMTPTAMFTLCASPQYQHLKHDYSKISQHQCRNKRA